MRQILEVLKMKDGSSTELVLSVLGNCCNDEMCRIKLLEFDGITLVCEYKHILLALIYGSYLTDCVKRVNVYDVM